MAQKPRIVKDPDGNVLWFPGPPRKVRIVNGVVYHARSMTEIGEGLIVKTLCMPTHGTTGEGVAEPPPYSKCIRCQCRVADIKRSRESNNLAFRAG